MRVHERQLRGIEEQQRKMLATVRRETKVLESQRQSLLRQLEMVTSCVITVSAESLDSPSNLYENICLPLGTKSFSDSCVSRAGGPISSGRTCRMETVIFCNTILRPIGQEQIHCQRRDILSVTFIVRSESELYALRVMQCPYLLLMLSILTLNCLQERAKLTAIEERITEISEGAATIGGSSSASKDTIRMSSGSCDLDCSTHIVNLVLRLLHTVSASV